MAGRASALVPRTPTGRLFLAALVVGAVLRLAMALSGHLLFDSDDAVVYLMAVQEAHGHLRAFFWGQPYGGTVLQSSIAVLVRVLGQHPLLSPLAATGWFLAAVLELRTLARRLYSEAVGDVAAALLWLPGGRLMRVTFFDPGFYAPTLALGLGAMLLATGPDQPSRRRVAAWGFLLGVGWWTSPNAVAFVGPALLLGLWRWRAARDRIVLAGLAAGAAALGAFPWLWANVGHGYPSLTTRHVARHLIPRRIGTVLDTVVPAALGTHGDRVLSHLTAVTVVLLLLGLLMHSVATRRVDRLVLAVSAPLGIVLVAAAAGGLPAPELRYTLFVLPAGSVAVALAAVGLTRRVSRRSLLTAGAVVTVTALSSVTTLRLSVAQNPTAPLAAAPSGERLQHVSADITQLRDALAADDIHAVYADYWAAYVLDLTTRASGLVACPTAPVRYRPYATMVAAAPRTTYVVYTGGRDEAMLHARVHVPAREFRVARWTVITYAGRVPLRGLTFRGF